MTSAHVDDNQEDTVAPGQPDGEDGELDDDHEDAEFASTNQEDMDTTPNGMDPGAMQVRS
jgi:hypothetical protein